METKQETHLTIEGMSCGACERHVREALEAVAGVTDVAVHLREGTACVLHDPEVAPVSNLVAAVERAGYGASAPT